MNTSTREHNGSTSRRLWRLAAVVVVLPVLLIGATASPASAANHTGVAWSDGFAWWYDSETFSADQSGMHYIPKQATTFGNTTLGSTGYRGIKTPCFGGEMYGVLNISFTNVGPSTVQVYLYAALYEGSSCSTTDLDGERWIGPIYLDANKGSKTVPVTVWNDNEGGDWMHFEAYLNI